VTERNTPNPIPTSRNFPPTRPAERAHIPHQSTKTPARPQILRAATYPLAQRADSFPQSRRIAIRRLPGQYVAQQQLCEQVFKDFAIVLPKAIREFVYIEHVWEVPLRSYADAELRFLEIEVKDHQPNPEKHAQGLEPA
jgi:hypothetical protein